MARSSTTTQSKATSRKRKAPEQKSREGPRKSARNAPRAQPTQLQLLKYILSDDARSLCRPDDEVKALESHSGEKPMTTYSSGELNPFQELVCAVVLSRPISHMLGLRTIRTLFNAPYEFDSAEKMAAAGSEKLHQALWDARTQHKAKTADQLFYLADLTMEHFTERDTDPDGRELGKVLAGENAGAALDRLVRQVKGFGPTSRDIFRRRIQWLWTPAYPFIDSRSVKALTELNLPSDGDGLCQLISQHWDELDYSGGADLDADDMDKQKRRALVEVLERATSADLEHKAEKLREAAALV